MNLSDDDRSVHEAQQQQQQQQHSIDAVVARGPGGAFAVAGVATFLVIAMFVLFYFVVYLPRGTVQ